MSVKNFVHWVQSRRDKYFPPGLKRNVERLVSALQMRCVIAQVLLDKTGDIKIAVVVAGAQTVIDGVLVLRAGIQQSLRLQLLG